MATIIGIDPGQTGGIAVLSSEGVLTTVVDMPMVDGRVDGRAIYRLINNQHTLQLPAVWLEEVHSMPKQGVASTFKFGKSYGIVIGAVESSRATINYAKPTQWKKHFGLSSSKQESLELARELFPDNEAMFRLKKHDGRAEAALIALYGLEHTPS